MKLLGFAVILAAVTTIMAASPHKNLVSVLEPGSVLMKPVKKSPPLKMSDENILCEIVTEEVDVFISESSEQVVEFVLENFCSLLDSEMQQECEDLAYEYGPEVAYRLSQEIKPKMLCKGLQRQFKDDPKPEKPECVWCKFVMEKTQSLLARTSEEDVLGTVGKLCTFFPVEVQTKCVDFIKRYGKIGLDVITKQTPEQSCKALGLCTSSLKKEDQKLRGKGKAPWRKILLQRGKRHQM